ncbi:hypothetical protein [Bradyrhizobium sp. USDA 4473]
MQKRFPVICIEARHAEAAVNATCRNDVKDIAQMMRTGWFRAVHVRPESAQTLQALRVGRTALLVKLLNMVNTIRDSLRTSRLKVGDISAGRLEAIKHCAC